MPTFLSEILGQLRNIWAQLSAGQRATMGAVLAATAVGFALLIFYATRPDYAQFMSATEGTERRRLMLALDEAGVDYRVDNMNILVNGADRAKAEAAVDKRGLRGTNGGEDYGNGSGFTQDRDQRAYALQMRKVRRVEQQLRDLRGVRSAKVVLFEPGGPVLLRKREPRRASVVLSLAPSAPMSSLVSSTRGIVASGLGIDPDKVHVTDSVRGSFSDAASGTSALSPVLELQARMSHELTMRAVAALDSMWPGKTAVTINAQYDNKITQRTKSIVSEDKIVVGETSYKTKDSTSGRGSGDPNGVGGSGASATGGSSGGDKESSVNQVDKRYNPIIGEERIRTLAPDLVRLSVSLGVDESIAGQSSAVIEQVKGAINWLQGRDAEFTAAVVKIEEFTDLPAAGGNTLDMVKEWAPLVGQLLSVIFVLFFLKGLLKKTKPAASSSSTLTPSAAAAAAASASAAEDDGESVQNLVELRNQIESVVSEDPASVSRLLESWLAQKESA